MDALLDFVKVGFASPTNTLVGIILFIAAVRGLYEFVKWVKSEMEVWYNKKYTADEKSENIEDRLTKLEETDERQINAIKSLEVSLSNIDSKLDDMSGRFNHQCVAVIRHSLYSMYPQIKEQGYLTQSQYETWKDLADVYLSKGGNHTFAEKIIPEVDKLEVRDY